MTPLHVEHRSDGSTILRSTVALPPYPARLTDPLAHWAAATPDATFLAERDGVGWRRLSYRAALDGARAIGTALLGRAVSAERPVLILSGNSIDHALLALACLHIGVPYAPISTAYALASQDLAKLRQIVALATPGLVYAAGAEYRRAIDAVLPPDVQWLDDLAPSLATVPGAAMDAAAARVDGDTVAKLLFTSGSTGAPKAVINTHRMLCANQAMLAVGIGHFLREPPVLLDWLPWSHTFGGNHNFNLVMFRGGTLFIDPGRPVPGQFDATVAALREVAPTLHLAVPKAWEELAARLRADPALNRAFHSRLRVRFYAAASLSQPLWNELAALSREATGKELPMLTGFGSTETAPMALCTDGLDGRAGHVGLPLPSLTVKLAPVAGKLEIRLRGPSIMPSYWRDPARTADAFDADGYYRLGDAVAWVDPDAPERGLRFDGRLAEDFKLATGTWVSVGPLRTRLIAAMAPHVRDIVLAGHDRDTITALALPFDPAAAHDPTVRAELTATLAALAAVAPGSAARVTRMAFLASALSIDDGEVTDKGSLNQAAVLRCRTGEVAALYAEPPPPHVLCI